MNQKMLAIAAAVTTAVALSGLLATMPVAYADESETEIEHALKQSNAGSGESTNDNCGQNSIDGFLGITICEEVDIGAEADGLEPSLSKRD